MKKCRCQSHDDRTGRVPMAGLVGVLLAAMVRLGVALGIAGLLAVLLLNEIATALVYNLAGILSLFVWPSCG